MATITFYSASPTDQQRFSEILSGTGLDYVCVSESVDHVHSNSDAAVISIFVNDSVTADVMDTMPNLKLIATRSTGFDHIDVAAARERGITVVNVPRYGEATVAEFTFALLLNLTRRIADSQAAFGKPHSSDAICGVDLNSKTFGIIGSGKIGQHAAHIAKGFGMEVIAYDPYPNNQKAQEIGFSYVPLDELAARSDVISLHAPATPDNHHLVDSRFLQRVKSSAVLVNTARGELVDTEALLERMQTGSLAGAALDVLEHEALLHDDADTTTPEARQALEVIQELQALPNVILTPHNAFNTHEAVDRIRQTTAQNIIDFYKGKTPNKVEG